MQTFLDIIQVLTVTIFAWVFMVGILVLGI